VKGRKTTGLELKGKEDGGRASREVEDRENEGKE
jgi:hypothetical protein